MSLKYNDRPILALMVTLKKVSFGQLKFGFCSGSGASNPGGFGSALACKIYNELEKGRIIGQDAAKTMKKVTRLPYKIECNLLKNVKSLVPYGMLLPFFLTLLTILLFNYE